MIEVGVNQRGHGRSFTPVLQQRALELAAISQPGQRVAHRSLLGLEYRTRGRQAGAELRYQALQLVRGWRPWGQLRTHHDERADREMTVEQRVGRPRAVLAPPIGKGVAEYVLRATRHHGDARSHRSDGR